MDLFPTTTEGTLVNLEYGVILKKCCKYHK